MQRESFAQLGASAGNKKNNTLCEGIIKSARRFENPVSAFKGKRPYNTNTRTHMRLSGLCSGKWPIDTSSMGMAALTPVKPIAAGSDC